MAWLGLAALAAGQDAAPAAEPAAKKTAADAAAGQAAAGEEQKEPALRRLPARVAVLDLTGEMIIMGGVEEYVIESIARAETEEFGLLVIELDTPGGAVSDTQAIVKAMLAARVPVAVFVTPKGAHAGSAGTFITMAGHVAAMAPGTRLGAAHPVQMQMVPDMGGEKQQDQTEQQKQQKQIMREKITNDVVGFIISIAKQRGRNAEWAEKAVRESLVATEDEALDKNVIDLVAEDLDDLLAQIHGREVQLDKDTRVVLQTRGAEIARWDMSLKQKVWTALADPNLLMILILLGLGGLAMEFYHPGLILPGGVGVICLLLAGISLKILPVDIGGLLLVLVGIGLMVAEAFVTSYGLLALAGAGLFVLGGILLVDPSSQPHYLDPDMQVDWSVLLPAAISFAGLFILVGYFVVRTQRGKVRTGAEGMVGELGEARGDIGPEGGKVFVHGEWWSAVSREPIAAGSLVEVVGLRPGMKLEVKPHQPEG
jgi:membrane-bound serine protease (ClpP class)